MTAGDGLRFKTATLGFGGHYFTMLFRSIDRLVQFHVNRRFLTWVAEGSSWLQSEVLSLQQGWMLLIMRFRLLILNQTYWPIPL